MISERSFWNAIPSNQELEISQADFIQYVNFWRIVFREQSASFARATETESGVIRGHANKTDTKMSPKPEQASIWWIRARTSDLRELKFAVPVTLDDAGVPYFSKSGCAAGSSLYNYLFCIAGFFCGSKDALTALIGHNLTIRSKLQKRPSGAARMKLLIFYRDHVSTGKAVIAVLK